MLKLGLKVYHILVVIVLSSILLTSGCYKFEGNQTIPAYISISSIKLQTYYPEQGTDSEEIVDVWVYVNDELLGVYEFPDSDSSPLILPVLAEGKNKIEIRPGIKLNGISSTRVPYPFYKPIIIEDFDFIPGVTQELVSGGVLTTTYYSNTEFAWFEDFEESDISIDDFGDTIIARTMPDNNPIAFLSPTSRYSGIINLTSEDPVYYGTSYNSFEIPTAGTVTILEMNFKTNNYFQVGLLIRDKYEVVEKELVILSQSDEWKKIYINLGSNLSLYPQAYDYKVIFRAGLGDEEESGITLIDNIKVVFK